MRVLLAGDSTVAACPPEEYPMSGWGAALDGELRPGDEVLNFARGGATTESFIAEGRWAALLAECRAGDLVIIQFGHNDQKQPERLAAEGGYRDRLQRFVRESRAAGATPVLCTSVERRLFTGGKLQPSHGAYPAAVRGIAARHGVPLIDLTVFTSWLYRDLGAEGSRALFTELDDTHFHERGARTVAAFVAGAVAAIIGSDDALAPLGKPE